MNDAQRNLIERASRLKIRIGRIEQNENGTSIITLGKTRIEYRADDNCITCVRCASEECVHVYCVLIRHLRIPRSSLKHVSRRREYVSRFERRWDASKAVVNRWAGSCSKCATGFRGRAHMCCTCEKTYHPTCFPRGSKCPDCHTDSIYAWPRVLTQ